MATSHGSVARIYVAGFDLSPFLTSATVDETMDAPESTTLVNSGAKSYHPGLEMFTLAAEGIFDGGADAVDEVLEALRREDNQLGLYAPTGGAIGTPAYGFAATESSYGRSAPLDDIVRVTAGFQGTTALDRGLVLHALGAESANGDGAAQDNGALSSAGGRAYCLATAPAANAVEVKVQHSVDSSAWVDLVTFNVTTAGRFAARTAVAGTVNRYLRALWTTAGASSPFVLMFARY